MSVRVIKRLIGNKWAIGIKGQVFPATSDIELASGQMIRTQVRSTGGTLTLQIKEFLKTSTSHEETVQIRSDTLKRALSLAGVVLDAPRAKSLGRLFGRMTMSRKGRESRVARLFAVLLDKGIDPSARALEEVIQEISFCHDSTEEKSRKRDPKRHPDQLERLKRLLKKRISEREQSEDAYHTLHLLNHLKGRHDNWFTVPFDFYGGFKGLLKVLVAKDQTRVKRLILDIPFDEEVLSFVLTPRGENVTLHFHCERKETRLAWLKKMGEILPKLQNHGVEYDDSIYDGGDFDGFAKSWEDTSYTRLDIVT